MRCLICWLFCGFFMLLGGIELVKSGLSSWFGHRGQELIGRRIPNATIGAVIGFLATAILQSSSAVTVAMIAMVDAGIMSLSQAFSIIVGSNIGTTLTAQIAALDLGTLGVPLVTLGLVFLLVRPFRAIGFSLSGFGAIFLGIETMTQVLEPLAADARFVSLLASFGRNPSLGILAGTLVTAAVQSSSAVTSAVVALCDSGILGLSEAIPVILGSNIGTCVTGLIASVRSTAAGKAVAVANLIFNAVGVLFLFPFLEKFTYIVSKLSPDLGRQAAGAHLLFNLISGILVLLFMNQFVKMVTMLLALFHH